MLDPYGASKNIIIDDSYIDFYKKIFELTNTKYYNYKFITFDIMSKLIGDSFCNYNISEESFAIKYEMCGSIRKITDFECKLDYEYLYIITKIKKIFHSSINNIWTESNKIKNNYLDLLNYETIKINLQIYFCY